MGRFLLALGLCAVADDLKGESKMATLVRMALVAWLLVDLFGWLGNDQRLTSGEVLVVVLLTLAIEGVWRLAGWAYNIRTPKMASGLKRSRNRW